MENLINSYFVEKRSLSQDEISELAENKKGYFLVCAHGFSLNENDVFVLPINDNVHIQYTKFDEFYKPLIIKKPKIKIIALNETIRSNVDYEIKECMNE